MAGFFLFIIFPSLIFIIVLKLITSISKPNKNNTTNLPPGPTIIPIIGILLLLRKNLLHIEPLLRHLRAKHGPIFSLRLTSLPSIFISDRTLVHKALILNGAVFADRPPALAPDHLITSNQLRISSAPYGPLWRHLRRNLFSKLLDPSRIKLFSSTRRRALDTLLHDLQSQSSRSADGTVVAMESFHYSMFCLASFMCFGEDVDEKTIREIESVQRSILLSVNNPTIFGLFPRISNLLFRSQSNMPAAIRRRSEEIFIPLIRTRRVRNQTSVAYDHAYVDSLFDLQLPEDNEKENRASRKLGDEEIVSLCSEFLTGATETTVTALEWIMANLVKHQEIQAKLYEEIQGVVGREAEEVKEEELQRMPYLKAVVLEGLRRHPPGHFLLPHGVTEDVMLNGYVIPKGSEVNFTVAKIGTDEDIWEKPMEFRPERFMEGGKGEGVDLTGKWEVKMIPFGIGRRICPGLELALLHLKYFVANLIRKFEWKSVHVDGEKIDMSEKLEFTVAMKNPLHVRISSRTKKKKQ